MLSSLWHCILQNQGSNAACTSSCFDPAFRPWMKNHAAAAASPLLSFHFCFFPDIATTMPSSVVKVLHCAFLCFQRHAAVSGLFEAWTVGSKLCMSVSCITTSAGWKLLHPWCRVDGLFFCFCSCHFVLLGVAKMKAKVHCIVQRGWQQATLHTSYGVHIFHSIENC